MPPVRTLAVALAFVLAALIMMVVAQIIERLVLRHLVNQEGTTLLMATLGIAYLLEGAGQMIFGNDIYKIDIGLPKDPMFLFEQTFDLELMAEDVTCGQLQSGPLSMLARRRQPALSPSAILPTAPLR
mgnify:CR=1 FL=1